LHCTHPLYIWKESSVSTIIKSKPTATYKAVHVCTSKFQQIEEEINCIVSYEQWSIRKQYTKKYYKVQSNLLKESPKLNINLQRQDKRDVVYGHSHEHFIYLHIDVSCQWVQ
jgi:hypothetical protein